MLKSPFPQYPRSVAAKLKGLAPRAKLVYLYLLANTGEKPVNMTRKQLADVVQLSLSSVRRSLRELAAAGVLEVKAVQSQPWRIRCLNITVIRGES